MTPPPASGRNPYMAYSIIGCEDGVDTVALQDQHPELFNVHTTKDGVSIWMLRPEVRAAIRAPIETALQKWITARERFEATGDEDDKAAAIAAIFEYTHVLEGHGKTNA